MDDTHSRAQEQADDDAALLRLLSSFIRPDAVPREPLPAEGGYLTRELLVSVLAGEFW
jgi:hypothetical protein